jgi:hypothetical protein
MLHRIRIATLAGVLLLTGPASGFALEGRIAYSADGNQHDVDDWASAPMALAIIHAFGAQERLVHFDYNSHLGNNHAYMCEQQTRATLTAAECYGFDKSVFIDDQAAQDAAVASIRDAVNASSAGDPLWMIVAGPVEVVYLGLAAADKDKLQFVTCISHATWNNDHSDEPPHHHHGPSVMTHTSRDVAAMGVKWVQIPGQWALHPQHGEGRERTQNWEPFAWMKAARDPRLRYIYRQMELESKPDVSDAGMVYYLFTGNEHATPDDLRNLLDKSERQDFPAECRGPLNEFEEVDGLVAVEAEHWHRLDKQDVRRWYIRVPRHYVDSGLHPEGRVRKDGFPFIAHAVDASSQAFLELGSETRRKDSDTLVLGENTAAAPGEMGVVTYRIFFNTPGRYRAWVRANSTGDHDDAIYVGIDDVWPAAENVLEVESPDGAWGWSCGAPADGKSASRGVHVDVATSGFHEVMFSMKDDGFEFDKFVLEAESRGFQPPAATGPSERPYQR